MTRIWTAALAFALAITAVGCGDRGGSGLTEPPPSAPVASVLVAPTASTLNVGAALQLSATAQDAAGHVLGGHVAAWASSAPAVAGVSSTGLVTAVGVGTATISATVEGKVGTATIVIVPANMILSAIHNPDAFMSVCPTSDSAYATIQRDFHLLSDGVPDTVAIACANPYTTTPTLTDELAIMQSLRMIYYMSQGSAGRLPWTSLSLYDWLTSQIAGVDLHQATGNSYCCDYVNGRPYVGISRGKLGILVWRDWVTMLGSVALLAHEARHVLGPGHVSGCPDFPLPTDPPGCDATYDLQDLGSYGIQYWLYAGWASGSIDLGIGCLPGADAQTDVATLAAMANSYIGRFVSNAPSPVVPAAPYGGVCMR